MTVHEIQSTLGLSDRKFADALGVTRQTIRNWKKGGTCPTFCLNSLRWLMELRRLHPDNDNIPKAMRLNL